MSLFLNIQGTLNNIFSLGKGSDTVKLRSNSGVLQVQNIGLTSWDRVQVQVLLL